MLVRFACAVGLVAGLLVTSPSPVTAAPRGNARYYLDVVNPKTTVCTGAQVFYTIRVIRAWTAAPPGWRKKELPPETKEAGVTVRAEANPQATNQLLIRVDYRIHENNAIASLVYPYFVTEGM